MTEPTPEELTDQLREQMQKWWGYSEFRSLQADSMLRAMQRKDSLTVLPTGGGKSLCYQVPAVTRPGLAVVVSPLISLMKDQVDSLRSLGVSAGCINSSQEYAEKREVTRQIRSGQLKLLYISPERLVQPRTLEFLQQQQVSFVAVDEAHCISQWGHQFRPEYRQLSTLREHLPNVSVHAYTATATQQVREDIVTQLGLREAAILVGPFDRPNLLYRVERRAEAIEQIRSVLARHRDEAGIIYCISRKNVEAISEKLNHLGHRTRPYHAGLSDEQRRQTQDDFAEERVPIIVATVAFGMGIDKSNVRFVIHAGMPGSLENYQQESGRAGRDGLDAECTLLYSPGDAETWRFLTQDPEYPEVSAAAEQSLRAMQRYCTAVRCRHAQLVEHFGQQLNGAECRSCDICLREVEEVEDALIVARKILSGVVRQGQRFGIAYTAQVLRGSAGKRIRENRHHELSTWGLLKQDSETDVRNWIEQLITQKLLRQTGEFRCLELTAEGWKLLQEGAAVTLMRERRQQAAEQHSTRQWEGIDRDLFNELRGLRSRLAAQRNLPPYVIFSDATLRAVARERPITPEQLRGITGIGEKKLEQFGAALLYEVDRWNRQVRPD